MLESVKGLQRDEEIIDVVTELKELLESVKELQRDEEIIDVVTELEELIGV